MYCTDINTYFHNVSLLTPTIIVIVIIVGLNCMSDGRVMRKHSEGKHSAHWVSLNLWIDFKGKLWEQLGE